MSSPAAVSDRIAAAPLKDTSTANLIDGAWCAATDGATFERRSPARPGDRPARFPDSGAADVDRAARAARVAFGAWVATPPSQRAAVLEAAAGLAADRLTDWTRDVTRETGKTLPEARAEVERAVATLRYFAADAWFAQGEQFAPSSGRGRLYTLRRPRGPVGLITPWNFPLAIPAWKLAPALMAGDSVVLKPAEQAPASAVNLVAALADAGLPRGVANLVLGRGPAAGEALVAHPEVTALSFTGSSAVGRRVREAATRRRAPVQLELGGQNPLVVMADADLGRAVEAAFAGAFLSAGQKCTATRRILVQEPLYASFRSRLVERIERSVVGDPESPETEIGPVVSEASRAAVLEAIERGRREGGRLLTDPRADDLDGPYLRPALLEDVAPGATLAREEVFGPVATLHRFGELDEAIALANAVEHGLSAAIFTAALESAERFVGAAQAGVIHVNSPTTGADVHVPFGGIKASGWGPREQGRAALELYTEVVTVYQEP